MVFPYWIQALGLEMIPVSRQSASRWVSEWARF